MTTASKLMILKEPTPHKYLLVAVIVSFIVASALLILPFSQTIAAYRPQFMFLVTLYWLIAQPYKYGMGLAFFMGLLSDLLLNTTMGQNTLAFSITAYAIQSLNDRNESFKLALNWLHACAGIFCYLCVNTLVASVIAQNFKLAYWQQFIPSFLIWPILYFCLRRFKL